MTGFADLIPRALPALYGDGVVMEITAGTDVLWKWIDVIDDDGDAIDLTAVTGTVTVGSDATSFTFTGASDGSFTVTSTATLTADLASQAGSDNVARLAWSLILAGPSSKKVAVWAAQNSTLLVKAA